MSTTKDNAVSQSQLNPPREIRAQSLTRSSCIVFHEKFVNSSPREIRDQSPMFKKWPEFYKFTVFKRLYSQEQTSQLEIEHINQSEMSQKRVRNESK